MISVLRFEPVAVGERKKGAWTRVRRLSLLWWTELSIIPFKPNQTKACLWEETHKVMGFWWSPSLLVLNTEETQERTRSPFKLFQEGGSSFLLFQLILSIKRKKTQSSIRRKNKIPFMIFLLVSSANHLTSLGLNFLNCTIRGLVFRSGACESSKHFSYSFNIQELSQILGYSNKTMQASPLYSNSILKRPKMKNWIRSRQVVTSTKKILKERLGRGWSALVCTWEGAQGQPVWGRELSTVWDDDKEPVTWFHTKLMA